MTGAPIIRGVWVRGLGYVVLLLGVALLTLGYAFLPTLEVLIRPEGVVIVSLLIMFFALMGLGVWMIGRGQD